MSEEKKMIHRINLHFDNQIYFVPFTHSLMIFFPSQGQGLVYLIYTDFFFYLLCKKKTWLGFKDPRSVGEDHVHICSCTQTKIKIQKHLPTFSDTAIKIAKI